MLHGWKPEGPPLLQAPRPAGPCVSCFSLVHPSSCSRARDKVLVQFIPKWCLKVWTDTFRGEWDDPSAAGSSDGV